jgi:hypothetical protein
MMCINLLLLSPAPSLLTAWCRYLNNNGFSGGLSAQLPCSYPQLQVLSAAANQLNGTLPPSWWGRTEAGFKHLATL